MRLHRSTVAVAATVLSLAGGTGVAWACTGGPGDPGKWTTTGTTDRFDDRNQRHHDDRHDRRGPSRDTPRPQDPAQPASRAAQLISSGSISNVTPFRWNVSGSPTRSRLGRKPAGPRPSPAGRAVLSR